MTHAWSFSALKDFETCRRKYAEVKVFKRFKQQDSEHNLSGLRMHKAAENFMLHNTPLPPEFAHLNDILSTLREMPGRKLCEVKWGLRADLTPCDFFDKDVWVRALPDLAIIDDDNLTARVFDYKAGKPRYADTDQLKLLSLIIFAQLPHIRSVTGGLLFINHNHVERCKVTRDDEAKLWQYFRERVAKITACHASGVWAPTQNGLCARYCPVTSCEYNSKH